MSPRDKPLVWLYGQIKTPPMSREARIEAGYLLRQLQRGEKLSMPHSRPMPTIGRRCHELRVGNGNVLQTCRKRLKDYDDASGQT